MKLAIIGSRGFEDYPLFEKHILNRYYRERTGLIFDTVISGGARGVDSMAVRFAKEHKINLIEFLPDWDKHGKAAGPIRNEDIINEATEVCAFWDAVSKGTANSLSIAKRLKKTTTIIYV